MCSPGTEEICSTKGCILPSVKTLNFTLSENTLFLKSPYLICFRSEVLQIWVFPFPILADIEICLGIGPR